jgi:hypothetical protein
MQLSHVSERSSLQGMGGLPARPVFSAAKSSNKFFIGILYPSGRILSVIVIAVGRKYGAVTFYRKMLLPRDNLRFSNFIRSS